MEEKALKEQQLEALTELYTYLQKLIPAVESMAAELRGAKQPDTNEVLLTIINGINWTIEVINLTMDIVNEAGDIDKASINQHINLLGNAISKKNDLLIADSLEKEILPFLLLVNAKVAVITMSAR